jgi:hypothetical protein
LKARSGLDRSEMIRSVRLGDRSRTMGRKTSSSKKGKKPSESHEKGRLLEHLVRLLESSLSDRDCTIKLRHHLTDKATG